MAGSSRIGSAEDRSDDGAHRTVGENPGVLALAAALHRDDRHVLGARHARQAAWHHRERVAGGADVGPEHDRPRLEAVPVPHRCARQFDVRLRGEVLGPGANRRGELLPFARAELAAEDRVLLPGGKRRLDDELVEMLDDVVALGRLTAPPGRRRATAATPRRAARGRATAGTAGARPSRSPPSRGRWRRRRCRRGRRRRRPATPRKESPRSSSGSQKLSSRRRKITLTRCRPSSVLMKTRRSRTVRSAPSTSVKPR